MESYIQNAWENFLLIVNFMQSTVIFTIGGLNITFLGLLICTMVINILYWLLFELLGFIEI